MRLLLAEDEKSLSRAVTVLLRKSNYEVDSVYDGEEALAYLSSGNYDGAILDIMMPKVDGIQVLASCGAGSRLPVLAPHCQGGGGRQGAGPGQRGQRLPHQALRPARSCWPGSGP